MHIHLKLYEIIYKIITYKYKYIKLYIYIYIICQKHQIIYFGEITKNDLVSFILQYQIYYFII